MLRDPDFRKNLLVSIMTSVLVLLFIEPILKWLGNAIVWLGANIYNGITDSIYKSAALGFREESSFVTLILLVSILSGVFSAGAALRLIPEGDETTVIKRKNYRKIFSVVLTLLFLLDVLFLLGRDFATLQLNTYFNQKITILAAKIPEQKIKELKASWALMDKRTDYEVLTAEMNTLAKQFNIKFPAPLPGTQ
ncbi:MAG TPA: hypothetical protein VFP33_10255 [Gallionella sp.]|nr:hypothetical protein [Gallionella sp.]